MAYSCEICGKGKQFGHNVPFSMKKTNKVWKPNLQRTHLEIDGTKVRVKICTQCMRTLEKYKRDGQIVEQPKEEKSADTPKKPVATKAPKKPAAKTTA
jgi:large subunit ribosomal protein L28